MPDNLWGDGEFVSDVKAPVAILKEQAAVLTNLTKGVLQGTVKVLRAQSAISNIELRIMAPALDNYHYLVADVYHPTEVYPVQVIDPTNKTEYSADDEEQFKDALRKVFQSDKVRRAIAMLIAQSEAQE